MTAAARAERTAKQPGAACRLLAHGCAGCSRHPFAEDNKTVCGMCHGWRLRAQRDDGTCRMCGARSVCAGCGGRVACVACTQSGRAAAVAGTKRADTERAWAAGARARRRLGPVDEGGSSRWVGFAGLAQTTVERLLRLGDKDTADKHASNLPPAEVHKRMPATSWEASAPVYCTPLRMQLRRVLACVACCDVWPPPAAKPPHCSHSSQRQRPISQLPPGRVH